MQKTIQAPELRAYVATVLIAAGSSAEEAESIAANLVLANLSGHDSHGVGMLPRYVNAVLEGGLQPNTAVRVLLDTGSLLTQGKMRVAHNEGRRVEPGTLIDEHGQPTTDPGVVVLPQSNGLFGALLAFGEHKGYGLAVACELLGGGLTGGGTWHQPTDPAVLAIVNGMLTILLDPARLGTQAAFESEALAFVD